jgi:hypothetical protein
MGEFAVPVDPGHWQGVSTSGHPDLTTMEMMDVSFEVPCPATPEALRAECLPNLPWADHEFADRVSGFPTNPHPSLRLWPWWHDQTEATQEEGVFTHTYSERYYPVNLAGRHGNKGVRYPMRTLNDLVNLLEREPHTRQAYLPVFFPEDTGAVHGGRVPCTLGYQFLLRNSRLHMWYFIRSCDVIRHFQDDLYLSARLQLWVLEELTNRVLDDVYPSWWQDADVGVGNFYFHCCSLHYHRGDEHLTDSI